MHKLLVIISVIFPPLFLTNCGGGDICGREKNINRHLEQDIERLQGQIDEYQSHANQYCECQYQYYSQE
jgi:hypothetical protein